MSGWEEVRRVQLAAPWEDFWVECYANRPIGEWLDFQDTVKLTMSDPRIENIEALVHQFGRFVSAHNITDAEGKPLEFTLRSMTASLVRAVAVAVQEVTEGGGELPLARSANSPTPSSPARKSRRASRSSAS